MGYGLQYEYGIFRQSIRDGYQVEEPDNWLRQPDPWQVARPGKEFRVPLHASFELRGSAITIIPNRPSTLIGIAHDRPVVGYGGRCVNTLRLWAAAAPKSFDFAEFSHGDFVGAVIGQRRRRIAHARALPGRLDRGRPDPAIPAGVLPGQLLAAGHPVALPEGRRRELVRLPDHVAIQLNDTHPALAVAELMRILLDEAHLGWDEAWDSTVRTLAYTNHTLLPEALEKWPVELFELLVPAAPRDHLRDQPPLSRRRERAVSRRRRAAGSA